MQSSELFEWIQKCPQAAYEVERFVIASAAKQSSSAHSLMHKTKYSRDGRVAFGLLAMTGFINRLTQFYAGFFNAGEFWSELV